MNLPSPGPPLDVLLVEDSPTDVIMTREALEASALQMSLHVVEDGVLAMQFLRGEGSYIDAPSPDLILLDLNLPRKDGREVLAELKQDPELKAIPVAVLTSSNAEEDVLHAYNLHANCYVVKPVNYNLFAQVVRAIEQFWFAVVKLPHVGKRP